MPIEDSDRWPGVVPGRSLAGATIRLCAVLAISCAVLAALTEARMVTDAAGSPGSRRTA